MNEYVSTSTIRDIHKLLRSCFQQAIKWELMEKNPCIYATVPMHKTKNRVYLFINKESQRVSKTAIKELLAKVLSNGIFVAIGRTKATMATEGNKFKLSTMCADVHGTTEGRVTTVDHFINIFHLSVSGMKSIFNFFIIGGKDFL